MIHVYDNADWQLAQRVAELDPFQLAQPLWINPKIVLEAIPDVITRSTPEQLATERQRQRLRDIQIIKENKRMAVKFIDEKSAPIRLHARGTISGTPEYRDTLAAIQQIPAGKAIVVDIESDELKKVKKPEVSFAYTIRRFLASHNIAATAYQSGKLQVVVTRSMTGAAPKKRK